MTTTQQVAVSIVSIRPAPLFQAAQVGDRVTILVHAGIGRDGPEKKEATGRVVMKFPTHLVLNMGGKFGRPGIADEGNTVRVKRAA